MTDKPKARKLINRKWYWIFGALALVVLGIIFALQWGGNRDNIFMAFLFAASWFGAFYLYYRSRQTESGGLTLDGARVDHANCVLFEERSFRFAYMDPKNLLGMPKQFTSDGKWYHIHKWNGKAFEEYLLPDKCAYYDTKEYANVHVLRAHQRLAMRKPTAMQQWSPVILGVMNGIAIFILFAMGGG